ncbi:MAG TPA: hypothetical protein PLL30_16435 [Candidatus Krumholzibacteria bacterium]|nr:hypothetical protein [Candidatus Krumholzibacteria bacterium]HPD73360.1 hypothetical protein [Candidatus Krumholzibacteria bacterium]HRY42119.1 hypothetical protein [Candidatus Krumholzibacteria bacterium]
MRAAAILAALAGAILLSGCADDDVRTYEVYISVGNLLGDGGADGEPSHAFVATLRQSTDGQAGWFGYRERASTGWRNLLDARDIKRIWPGIGTVGFAELRANAAGELGFCGYPNLVALDRGDGFLFADLSGIRRTAFHHVEPIAGSRIVFLGADGLFVDWREDGWELRETPIDTVLVSAWTDPAGALHVAGADGTILREDGEGWFEVLRWTQSSLGPSIAEPGGGRYFSGGSAGGILFYHDGALTALHVVPVASWWRPRSLGTGRFAIASAGLTEIIGFDATTWWVEAEFPGLEVRDVWTPDGERLLVATGTPDDRWDRRRAQIHERTDGVWETRDLHGMFGTEPASGGGKMWSPVAPVAQQGGER